jgi:flagellar hook-basal body complex protein FliE
MVNLNPNTDMTMSPGVPKGIEAFKPGPSSAQSGFSQTAKAVESFIARVDDQQQASNVSIQDLLAGKSEDITSVVSAVAKSDMSFKLLVGVRNKLVEAYKETMSMPL